jgi:RimJ/RimL family protein N-acetyltransferase
MIDLQPRLDGRTLVLRPQLPSDFDALYAAASDPLIWEVHPEPTRWQRDVFRSFFDKGIESRGALVTVDKSSGQLIGASRYYDCDPDKREIAIGYTFLARSHWGGVTNREMKALMLDHVFQWAETVWFHVGRDNVRSRKAMEKIGGQLSHYADMELAGAPHPYAYYRITKDGWLAG